MPLETANYIFDLVPTNPPDTDLVQQGDDHIRLIKKVIQQTWPGLTGPNLPTSTGSANAQIVTHVYGPAAYVAGQIVTFKAGFTNTGPTTINVNGGGPVTLSQGGAALTAGAVVAGNNYTMIYDPSVTGFALIASSMGYLPLVGGTLSGGLTINAINALTINSPAGVQAAIVLNKAASGQQNQIWGRTAGSNRWLLNFGNAGAESGANAGSDLALLNYDDTGTNIGVPLSITRSTGATTLTGALTVAPASGASVIIQNVAAGVVHSIVGQTAGLSRWALQLGNGSAETGSNNAGSDFVLNRFSDSGTLIDTPLGITRSTGNVIFSGAGGNVQVAPATGQAVFAVISTNSNASLTLRKGASGQSISMTGYTGANARWAILPGDAAVESGGNVGSAFAVYRYNDAGTFLDAPMSAVRTTGQFTFTVAIVNGPSDRALKENIVPLEGALGKVLALQGVSFNFIATPDKPEIGLIAQDVEPIVPEVVQTFQVSTPDDVDNKMPPKLGLDYPKLTALLIEAVKELTARVKSLEDQLGVQHG